MNYNKVIPSRDIRLKILKFTEFIPDKLMIKLQYYIKTKRKLNLKSPLRFTEKLQWYKLYYRNPLMTVCVDKYSVREYVSSKGLGHILIPLYGVYERVDDIDFEKLPDKFVLKATNGSHTNIICEDKSNLDFNKARKLLDNWINSRTVKAGREWPYYNVKPRII